MRLLARASLCALAAALVSGLSACALNSATSPQRYDLGPAPVARMSGAALDLNVQAAPGLDDTEMIYRLDYADPHRALSYRDSRWQAAPTELLAARLRQSLSGHGSGNSSAPGRTLRLELFAFEQEFSAPEQSQARLRVHAWLQSASGLAEQDFDLSLPGGADAASGVAALSRATDQLAERLLTWTQSVQ